ncbi:hypothetical protein D3C87_1091340 [compost metagenome]
MKPLLEHFANATRNMQSLYIIVFILAAFLLRTTLYIYTSTSEPTLAEYIASNLLPEISGMIIELVLILFVVDAIQNKERKDRENSEASEKKHKQIMLERRLRAQLRFLIRQIFEDVAVYNGTTGKDFLFHAADHLKNQETINNFKKVINEEILSESFRENLKNICLHEQSLILALSPVCSELSDRHVKAWMAIAHYLQKITTGNNSLQNIERLLSWIAFFDKQTFIQGLINK